ncbi:ECF transporter S component [Streptococcus pluranimalium]|uniref:ECF transporter S component n=1 Tax=Streptococcus pluranimalium TaxID=82348 RepID=UPI0039FDD150
MRNAKTQELTLLAILTALTIVLGMFVKMPTPTGVTTLLDVGIYFTAFYFGKRQGAIVGGLSAFLFDLLAGYPQWMFISLVAHGGQGYLAGMTGKKRPFGVIAATVFMVLLYLMASSIMNGLGAALAEVLTNTMQNIVGIIGAVILNNVYKKYVSKK